MVFLAFDCSILQPRNKFNVSLCNWIFAYHGLQVLVTLRREILDSMKRRHRAHFQKAVFSSEPICAGLMERKLSYVIIHEVLAMKEQCNCGTTIRF